ncbi:MAG: hypothetical protein KAX38_06385 [Candidatus Krumholzibacteria bacterium]|nr:hypothetical protein [Candidatus Krumholzibacteria bacterium]
MNIREKMEEADMLLEKWRKRKDMYYERHKERTGIDLWYNAGLFDEVQTCYLELKELLEQTI